MRILLIVAFASLPCSGMAQALEPTPSDSLAQDSIPISAGNSIMFSKIDMMDKELLSIQSTLDVMAGENRSARQIAEPEKKKFVHFGLSLGYRWLTNESCRQNVMASVSPIDSTLRLTSLDRSSYLFSTSMVFDLNFSRLRNTDHADNYQKKRLHKQNTVNDRRTARNKEPRAFRTQRSVIGRFLERSTDKLCIVSNLNILDFSNGQKELAFNKSIEGGLGIGYRLNETMYLGLNWEHVKSIQLYDDIKDQEGEHVKLNGTQLVSSSQLDKDNEDLYYLKNLSGWGIKMIICL